MSWVTLVEEWPMSLERSSMGTLASCRAQVANTWRRLWNGYSQRPSSRRGQPTSAAARSQM